MLAEAQRVIDAEFADPRTGMFATPTHYHVVENTGADAEGRPKGRVVKHERPHLPPGYVYVSQKVEGAQPDDAIQSRISIERDFDEQEHSTKASQISAKRLFTDTEQQPSSPEKQPKTVASAGPTEGAEHTPGSTAVVYEERELMASDAEAAAAALPREEVILAQEPQAEPVPEMH
ncbi:hypothetical protein AAVH_29752, partial [Aphelenchoides avenae]